jgi:hypothetical protein
VSLHDVPSQARLDAAHGQLVHSLDEILNARRQALQEKERQPGVRFHRLSDCGVGEEQAACWLSRDRGGRINATGEKRNFSQGGAGFAGMDDELAAAAPADYAHFPLEDESNSFRLVAGGPKYLTG